jgi:hypothetical protein
MSYLGIAPLDHLLPYTPQDLRRGCSCLSHSVRSFPLPDLLRAHFMFLSVRPYTLPLFVSTTALPHVQRILPVVVVILYDAINTISHLPIQLLCDLIGAPHEEVYEPRICRIARSFQGGGERSSMAETTGGGRDGEGGDVAVPGEVVWIFVACGGWLVGRDGWCVWG